MPLFFITISFAARYPEESVPYSSEIRCPILPACLIGLKAKQVHTSCSMLTIQLIGFRGEMRLCKKQKKKISLFLSALVMLPVIGAT